MKYIWEYVIKTIISLYSPPINLSKTLIAEYFNKAITKINLLKIVA